MTAQTRPAEPATILATFGAAPLPVKTLLVGVFINRLSGFLNIFLVLFLTARGYSTDRAALALAVHGVGAITGVLVGGLLANRLGARTATMISMGGASVLLASLLYLPSYGLILVVVALISLAAQLYRPAAAALLSDLTPENRQVMIFAMYRFGLNVGATVAPLIGLGLYDLADRHYGLVFWCEGLFALAYAVLAATTLPARASGTGAEAGRGAEGRAGYPRMLRDRRYRLYLVAMFCQGAVYVQYLSTLPLDVRASGVAIFWYTMAVSLNGAVVIAFELLMTRVTQSWPLRLTLGVGLALIGIGVAAYGLPFGPSVILGATLIWSLGEIISGPATFAYPGVAAPPDLKVHYIGGFQLMLGAGTSVGPMLGALLFSRLGHHVWPVIAIGSVIATVLTSLAVGAKPSPVTDKGENSGRRPSGWVRSEW
jgi:MFS family permease